MGRFKPNATVALIIEHQGQILMVEEYDEEGRVVFGMPAGHIDAKEGILRAAIREGSEETGCAVELASLIGIYDYVKDYETIYRFCFEAKIAGKIPDVFTPKDPDGEILAVRWYSRDEIFAKKGNWRTRLVGMCLDDYFKGIRLPLSAITYLEP